MSRLDTWHWWTAANHTVDDLLTLKNEDVVTVDLNDAPAGLEKRHQQDNARTPRRDRGDRGGQLREGPHPDRLRRAIRPEPFNKPLNELENDAACAATIAAMKKATVI